MGVDYSATMVVGVKLDELFRVERENVQVTKYDPDTGAPYQTPVVKETCTWCGKPITMPDDLETLVKDMSGLEIYSTGEPSHPYRYKGGWNGYDLGEFVVGRSIANVDNAEIATAERVEVDKQFADVKQKLERSGYKGQVQIHLVLHVSC